MLRRDTFSPCTARFSTGTVISLAPKPRKPPRSTSTNCFLSALFSTTPSISPISFPSAPTRSMSPRASTVSIRVAVPSGDAAVVEPVVVPGAGPAAGGAAGVVVVGLEAAGGVAGAGSDVDVCATAGASMAIVMIPARPRAGLVIVVSFIKVEAGPSWEAKPAITTAALKVLLCNKGGGAQG